jgi:hypothetical protein
MMMLGIWDKKNRFVGVLMDRCWRIVVAHR